MSAVEIQSQPTDTLVLVTWISVKKSSFVTFFSSAEISRNIFISLWMKIQLRISITSLIFMEKKKKRLKIYMYKHIYKHTIIYTHIQELNSSLLNILANSTILYTIGKTRLLKPRSSACPERYLQRGHSFALEDRRIFCRKRVMQWMLCSFPVPGYTL